MRLQPSVASLPAWRAERTKRASRAVDVFGLAFRFLGTVKLVSEWMTSPNHDLGRSRPCDLLFSDRGAELVAALLRHRLSAIQSAIALADQVLDSAADEWLRMPNPELDGASPRDLLRYPEGAEVVEGLLRSIESAKCGVSP